MERRLAAILAADVVGYSSLMESDEAGTFERLKAHRTEIFEPDIKLHHGRIFKLMGDGLLAEFGSVVDAVECAVAVQKAMAKRNDGLAPEKRIDIRIGVNLGDVIVEGEDRHGEGVNIAARLEQLAPPGGICVSGTVIDHLSNKLPVGFEAMGEHQVKNIAKPVAVYRAKLDGAPVKRAAPAAAKPSWAWAAAMLAILLLAAGAWYALSPQAPATVAATDGKPSLVVLPFANLSDDKEQGYLADGITEDLTTELARVPGLFVISRNAAFTYKGKATPPAQIAKELGVHYLLEGSTRRVADDMRINAQLIDAQTGGHLWAERFDGKWADVFSLQNMVVARVADALELRLITVEKAASTPGGTRNPAAYEAYLQGLELMWRGGAANYAAAVPHLERAIVLDPAYGEAHAALAELYLNAANTPEYEQALKLAQYAAMAKSATHLAEALKHSSPRSHRLIGRKALRAEQFDEAIANFEHAVKLDPSNYDSYSWLAYAMIAAGRPGEGERHLDTALRLDPRAAQWLGSDLGFARFCAGRFEEAAPLLEKHVKDYPDNTWSRTFLVATYGHLGRDAGPIVKELDALLRKDGTPAFTQFWARAMNPFKRREDTERLRAGLGKAGLPEMAWGYDSKSKDRLTDEEIKSALFGHTLKGQDIDSGAKWTLAFASDGSFAFLSDSATATGSSDRGRLTEVNDGVMCWGYPATGGRGCGTLFRLPSGTTAQKSDLLWVSSWDRIRFSVIE